MRAKARWLPWSDERSAGESRYTTTRDLTAARRTQMHRFGKLMTRLADPESQTLLDPARQISRFKLGRHKEVKKILEEHREAFQSPECDRYALVEETSG